MKILVIDDERVLCEAIADYFEDLGHMAFTANNGRQGLEVFSEQQPDLVVLDLNMPEMDGFAVLDTLRDIAPETPLIVVSGVGVIDDAMRAVRLGAWDFLTKPIQDLAVLDHTVRKVMERARLLRENRTYREHLEDEVRVRTEDLRKEVEVRRNAELELIRLNAEITDTQKEVVLVLGEVVENRSKETAHHVRRVAEYCYVLARGAGMGHTEADILRLAAPMHDVGKIGIPDAILNKPGKLTPEEYEVIKTHTQIGYEILRHSSRPIMRTAATVAREHHEHWDGSGYPRGLKGEDIHIYGRVTCIADVFDALLHKRAYKDAWPLERVLDYFSEWSGTRFDPSLVRLLFDTRKAITEILWKYPDTTT
ncbi:MAG: HD domain-containing phosphohydrolase [Desulfovibrionaceae bacterium]